MKEPPKTQKILHGMPTDSLFACIGKIKSLPRLNQEIDNCKGMYSGMKSNYYYIGLLCDMIEFSLTKFFVVMTIIMLSPTLIELTTVFSKKGKRSRIKISVLWSSKFIFFKKPIKFVFKEDDFLWSLEKIIRIKKLTFIERKVLGVCDTNR